ncbi:MAG: AAA family ATPase [Dokdonella sp.]|uniref:ExeA family protein n=1 Tax=Dokdonella sp. TaxID=2291710 RepID=UPI0025BFD5B3|nr:ExeA family protein [Dokdonella sp.]MBZ0222676.1 AAA family ATPase [Dokdonella sp.]MCC7256253.1 AAA family ATPase [Dokdonella sp.]
MYLEHYGLREAPFSITPDPRYVFLSDRHRDALAHLLYGIGKGGSGGFVQLTGEVGTGKTTLCRLLLEQLPENTCVALVLNPKLSPVELVETVCEELKLDIEGKRGSLKALTDTLNVFLLDAYAQGLRVVLIIDEAQNLSTESLEQVRLLTNLETPTQKLLQIILLGQPELRELLEKPELRQLAQRITARYHLTPLDGAETEAYVRHRMAVAGCTRQPFTRLGIKALFRRSGGVPRLINIIADRALMAGYAREQDSLGERLVDRAADETLPGHARYWLRRYGSWAALIVIALAAAAGSWAWQHRAPPPTAFVAEPKLASSAATTDDGEDERLRSALAATPDTALIAYTQLLARWHVDAEQVSVRDAARCPALVAPGLACLRGRASLDQLARFDRPLLLMLGKAPHEMPVVLLGVGKERVRIDLAGQRFDPTRAALESVWDGDFSVLWRVPVNMPARLDRGASGTGVAWTLDHLKSFDGGDGASPGATFDAAMQARVEKLQQAYGIRADGIIGPETLFALSALDDDGPHLSRTMD